MTNTAFYCQRLKHSQRGTMTLLLYHHNVEHHFKRWSVGHYSIKWEPENDLLINTLRFFNFGQLTFAINDCCVIASTTCLTPKQILTRFYHRIIKQPSPDITVISGFWTTLSGSRYRLIDASPGALSPLDHLPAVLKEHRGIAALTHKACRIKDVSPVGLGRRDL
ncbi:protein ORF75 [Lake sturgeon herpesvirus]|nr:protein ORF75 [Lake sturgeon herpesvirus]